TPSWPAAMVPRQQAGHMTASDHVLPVALRKSWQTGGHPHMTHYRAKAPKNACLTALWPGAKRCNEILSLLHVAPLGPLA
ncbi:MAG: hypothetical protein WBD78_13920, partial [Methylocella sp.]